MLHTDRGSDDPMQPCHGRSALIEGGAKNVVGCRSIVTMVHVIFPRPNDLDRTVDCLRRLDGVGDEILFAAPPEAAAQQHSVDVDRLAREPGDAHCGSLGAGLILCSYPHFTTIFPDVSRAVHWLHGSMSEKRHF